MKTRKQRDLQLERHVSDCVRCQINETVRSVVLVCARRNKS